MNIRQFVNGHPKLMVPVVVGAMAFAAYFVYASNLSQYANNTPGDVFFSDDDGRTWYPQDRRTLSPSQHNGKEAFRVHLYECNGKRFVGYMERLVPSARTAMEQALAESAKGTPPDPGRMMQIVMEGTRIKAPGDREWKPGFGPAAATLRNPKCPDGTKAVFVD